MYHEEIEYHFIGMMEECKIYWEKHAKVINTHNHLSKEHNEYLEDIKDMKNGIKTLSQIKKKVSGKSKRKEERRNRLRYKS